MTRVDEIRKRLEKAWRAIRINSITPWTDALTIMNSAAIAHTTRGWEGDGTECDSSAQANAAFIANAPTDIALLLSELSRLERENDALRTQLASWEAKARGDELQRTFDAALKTSEARCAAMAEALKRLLSKYENCARAHGNIDAVIRDSADFAYKALSNLPTRAEALLKVKEAAEEVDASHPLSPRADPLDRLHVALAALSGKEE